MTDKGKALKYLCEKYLGGTSLENVYAFGDSMNDCGMMLLVGHGILVGNAHKEILDWYELNKPIL
jgi:hydroxymethylpyrimidine pyrophosphatase-like HAD family hydrolase